MLLRLTIRSDPVVQFFEPQVFCKICEGFGHSQISCDYSDKNGGGNMKYEDLVFWKYVDPLEQPDYFQRLDQNCNDSIDCD